MPGLLQRAIGGLLSPWKGLGLPVKIMYGVPAAHRLLATPEMHADSLPPLLGGLSLLADACITLKWDVVLRRSPASGTEIVDEGAAAETLAAWPIYDRFSFIYNGLLSGNGIARLEDGRLETYPVDRCSFRLYDDGRLSYLLQPVAGGPIEEVQAADVVHLRYRPINSFDQRIGISPAVRAWATVELLIEHRKMVLAAVKNAARPGSYLHTDKAIDQRKAEQIKERWDRVFRGAGTGGIAILEENLQYATIDNTDLVRLTSEAISQLGVADCARLYSIPPGLLLGQENRATAVEERRRLLSFAVSPLCVLIQDALAPVLLTPAQRRAGYSVRLDSTAETMLGQGAELSDSLAKLLNSGALSTNEARNRIGLASVEDGDLLRAPTNVWPLSNWAEAKPASGQLPQAAPTQLALPPPAAGTFDARRSLMLLTQNWEPSE